MVGAAKRGKAGTGTDERRMESVRRHFDAEARRFDGLVRKLIPHYGEMLEALVAALPFPARRAVEVLDLGCGTGAIGRLVLDRWPRACVTCVDISGRMLAVAHGRIGDSACARFHEADFGRWAIPGRYDAVLSSLAIHHLPDDGAKRALFRRVRRALRPGGAFWNADVVRGSSAGIDRAALAAWVSFMRRAIPEREIRGRWLPTHRREDRPAPLLDQLAWLKRAGFESVDVLWKYYGFAVYGGRLPAP